MSKKVAGRGGGKKKKRGYNQEMIGGGGCPGCQKVGKSHETENIRRERWARMVARGSMYGRKNGDQGAAKEKGSSVTKGGERSEVKGLLFEKWELNEKTASGCDIN